MKPQQVKSNHHFVIMGVSGSGKTFLGQKLSEKLKVPFYDADDYHPEKNIQKMKSGVPLTDEDRWPWLETLHQLAHKNDSNGYVIACSALKSSYRDVIQGELTMNWIYLQSNKTLVKQRLMNRTDHFMPASLIDSQFEILEEPENALYLDAHDIVAHQIEKILHFFDRTNHHNA